MDNLIGKQLKYKSGAGGNDVYQVVEQKDGMITFGNNAKVSENKVMELFEEIRTDSVNPDTFFYGNNGLSGIADALRTGQTSKTIGIPDNQIPEYRSEVSQDTLRQHEDYQKKIIEDQRRYNQQHGLSEEPVRKVMGESMREYVDDYEEYNPQSNQQHSQPVKRASESDKLFDKMRRTTPVKIKLQLDEMLPKKDSIKHFNDMFDEDESIIDKLAKEIANKYLSNPKLIQDLIADQLETMIYPGKRKKVKKKPVRRATVRKPAAKKAVVKLDIEEEKTTDIE